MRIKIWTSVDRPLYFKFHSVSLFSLAPSAGSSDHSALVTFFSNLHGKTPFLGLITCLQLTTL